ncbi:serine--tRNA ligase-like protein [Tanacetum coccineum]
MLDIHLFRKDPEIIRKSQARRFKSVDEIISRDKKLRQCDSELRQLNADLNKQVRKLKMTGGDARAMIQDALIKKGSITTKAAEVQVAKKALIEKWGEIDSVPTFEDEVTGEEKYIATSEQSLCAYHKDDLFGPKQLPIRYAGCSTCFRKKAGSHGRDTGGLFDVHQFEKAEQFCITSPCDSDSCKVFKEMINNCEEFYQRASICFTVLILLVDTDTNTLKLPYQVVAVVSGDLNDAATKTHDLEAWFPGSAKYRELASCSNCTDYQSRELNIKFQREKSNEQTSLYCHLLNSTLIMTEKTLCCILENYQSDKGDDE